MQQKINKKELNSNQSKDKILQAASKLFAIKGFDGATSKDIAELAGCSEGLIFRYFKDKKGVFNTITINWVQSCIEDLKGLPSSSTLEEEIRILINWIFKTYSKENNLNKIFIGQRFIDKHDDLIDCRDQYRLNRDKIVTQRLKKYQNNKMLINDIDVNQFIEILQGYAIVEILLRNLPQKQHEVKINSLVKLLLSGIKNDTM